MSGIRPDQCPGIAASPLSFRTRLDHGQLLAGLVRHPATAGRLDPGLGRRARLRGSIRGRSGDLRERNRDAPSEKRLIKPYIEFISAIPSVVLGFFGIAVVGEAIRAIVRNRTG